MKIAFIFFLLILTKTAIGNETNRIIAIVNQDIVTSQSIQSQLDETTSLEEKILLIDEKITRILQDQLVNKYDLSPNKNDIELALNHIAFNNNISLIELKNHPNFGFIESDVKKNLSILNLKSYLTKNQNFNISNRDIEENCSNVDTKVNKQIKIAEIIILEPPGFDSSVDKLELSSKEFLAKLSKHINKGASFIQFAKLHSQDPSYYNGGISDWKIIDSPFLKAMDNLQKNEISDIYKKNNGWAIAIKIDERRVNLKLENCKQDILQIKAQRYFDEYINNFKKNANITIYEQNL